MTPNITAFESSPDRGRGLARDMTVRWAFEEVGQPYDVRLVSFKAMKQPAHLALQPFGQIPTYEEGNLALFESGAIVLHICDRLDVRRAHDDAAADRRSRSQHPGEGKELVRGAAAHPRRSRPGPARLAL